MGEGPGYVSHRQTAVENEVAIHSHSTTYKNDDNKLLVTAVSPQTSKKNSSPANNYTNNNKTFTYTGCATDSIKVTAHHE